MSDQLYKEACQRERLEDCQKLAKRLERIGWENLRQYEQGVHDALQWAIGEHDEPPCVVGGDDE